MKDVVCNKGHSIGGPHDKSLYGGTKVIIKRLCNHVERRASCEKKKQFVDALTSDGEAAEAPFLLEGLGLANGGGAVNDDGVEDEAVLVALDLADHVGLGLGRAVVMDDTDTTLESHVDGHLVLSDSVHGRRDKGSLECDALGDGRVEDDLRGREANVAREEEEIVVGQTAVLGGVHELVEIEAIERLVLLEHIKGGLVVEDLRTGRSNHFEGCEEGGGSGGGGRSGEKREEWKEMEEVE